MLSDNGTGTQASKAGGRLGEKLSITIKDHPGTCCIDPRPSLLGPQVRSARRQEDRTARRGQPDVPDGGSSVRP